ncbi:MAG: hypothetical protein ACE5FL_15070 [Myxococcota bacterium]
MSRDADAAGPPGIALLAAALAAVVVLVAVYAGSSFGLADGADVLAFSSGIFDMDVRRVVTDLATGDPALRQSVHPLQKLLIAPFGSALDAVLFGGRDPHAAARIVIALCMAIQSLVVAVLAWQLTRRSQSAALAAGVLCAFSFSTFLAASIPESAAVAALASTLPLLLLNARWGRPLSAGECVSWGALVVIGLGLTLTQVVHGAIAFAVRLSLGREASAADTPARALVGRVLLTLAVAISLLWGGLDLQQRLYPARGLTGARHPLTVELEFTRTAELSARPVTHATRLLAHFFVIDFVAPFPAYSDFLMRLYGLDHWSLSAEEAGWSQWAPAQRALAGAVLLAVLAAAAGLRRADVRMLAPALCVASQLALHFFYGREYVLYSPHWHGVLVALLVAAAWRRFPARQRAMSLAAVGLALAMLVNDVAVMRTVYREVAVGLGADARDADGAPHGSP